MARGWFRWLCPAVAGAALAAGGLAQAPKPPAAFFDRPITAPVPDPQSTGPTSHGWPGTEAPRSVWSPQNVMPTPVAPPVLEQPPSIFSGYQVPAADFVPDAEGLRPLPGSLEDNFNKEVAARRLFRACTWNDYRLTGFPQTLLWEAPLGDKRAPRMQALGTNQDNYVNSKSLDTSIGTTVGLFRLDTPGRDLAFQLDVFAVALSRFAPSELIVSEYRAGVPLTWQRGDWRGKLSYEHTSSHLGDNYTLATGRLPIPYAKDEVVLGLSRDFDSLRIYGQAAYAFQQSLLGSPKRGRFEGGFQYVCPFPTGFDGAPYIAAQVTSRGELQYNPDGLVQVGWLWRNPYQRLANLRVFAEYYQGRSPYGQLVYDREKWTAVGVSADF